MCCGDLRAGTCPNMRHAVTSQSSQHLYRMAVLFSAGLKSLCIQICTEEAKLFTSQALPLQGRDVHLFSTGKAGEIVLMSWPPFLRPDITQIPQHLCLRLSLPRPLSLSWFLSPWNAFLGKGPHWLYSLVTSAQSLSGP